MNWKSSSVKKQGKNPGRSIFPGTGEDEHQPEFHHEDGRVEPFAGHVQGCADGAVHPEMLVEKEITAEEYGGPQCDAGFR